MNGLKQRLERLAKHLVAKERALLVLGALKEERPVDPTWRATMPEVQAGEFDGHIRKICELNGDLGWYMLVLYQEVEKLGLRLESHTNLILRGLSAWRTRFLMTRHTKEPVTEAEYRELELAGRADLLLADEEAGLRPEDGLEGGGLPGDEPDRFATDDENHRAALTVDGLSEEREARPRPHAAAGGSHGGELGVPVPLEPWALEYEVLPDEEVEQVQRRRAERMAMRRGAERAPMLATARLLGDEELAEIAETTPADDLLEQHARLLRAGVAECWRRLGAIDQVVEEVRHDLDGEDPLMPDLRELVAASRATLNLCKRQECVIGPSELEEPREEDLAWVRELMEAGWRRLLARAE